MRRPDWAYRLSQYLKEWEDARFEYGERDCCFFAAGAVDAMTGSTLRESLREKYKDMRSALAFIKEQGGLEQAVTQVLGRASTLPEHAICGSLVLVEADCGPTIGLCLGDEIVCIGAHGLKAAPRSVALRSWPVR